LGRAQTRLTDFSDFRTAGDAELTQLGALKTLLSEVLLLAREQRRTRHDLETLLDRLPPLPPGPGLKAASGIEEAYGGAGGAALEPCDARAAAAAKMAAKEALPSRMVGAARAARAACDAVPWNGDKPVTQPVVSRGASVEKGDVPVDDGDVLDALAGEVRADGGSVSCHGATTAAPPPQAAAATLRGAVKGRPLPRAGGGRAAPVGTAAEADPAGTERERKSVPPHVADFASFVLVDRRRRRAAAAAAPPVLLFSASGPPGAASPRPAPLNATAPPAALEPDAPPTLPHPAAPRSSPAAPRVIPVRKAPISAVEEAETAAATAAGFPRRQSWRRRLAPAEWATNADAGGGADGTLWRSDSALISRGEPQALPPGGSAGSWAAVAAAVEGARVDLAATYGGGPGVIAARGLADRAWSRLVEKRGGGDAAAAGGWGASSLLRNGGGWGAAADWTGVGWGASALSDLTAPL
jgi:hypothetical protein